MTVAIGCYKLKEGRCDSDSDCPADHPVCNADKYCVPKGDAGSMGGAGGSHGGTGGAAGSMGGAGGKAPFSCSSCKGTTPICDVDAGACRTCETDTSCHGLDAGTNVCVTPDAGVDGGAKPGTCVGCLSGADCQAATPICASQSCVACSASKDCLAANSAKPVCVTTATASLAKGMCVGCLSNTDCHDQTPICNTSNVCTACSLDADCAGIGPGICVGDGHCAASTEVVYLDESVSSCPSADGTAAKPYCAFAQATGALIQTRPILVIVGGTKEQLALAPTSVAPLIIGRPNTSGDPGSIPATNGTAIAISSGTVLIRDLTVNSGSSKTMSKGIVISGTANVTLLRVVVSLTTGLGVDAETGSTLTMTSCTVNMNNGGGILLNEANFKIENTTVTSNGPGTVLGTSTLGGILVSNATPVNGTINSTTIANNGGPGLTCAATISGTNVLVFNNSSGNVTGCGITPCADAGPTCGAQ
jgi:hypothetical protein